MNSNVAVLLPYPTEGGGILLISTTADGIMIMIIDHEDVEPARVYVCVCACVCVYTHWERSWRGERSRMMDIQFGYTTVVRLLFSQWNLARSQFLARRGTIFDFERVEIGNLYTFLFFRSSRLINSKEFIFHFNYTSFYYWNGWFVWAKPWDYYGMQWITNLGKLFRIWNKLLK